jgi:very-short-patch-repair endonuclease
MDRTDITVRSEIRLTNVERTLLDLADRVSRSDLEVALEDALRRRLTTTARLAAGINGRWWLLPGAKTLRYVLGRHGATVITDSRLESKLFDLLRRARLPLPQIQHEIRDGGRFVARADFAYPEARFIIEAHSFRWHSARKAWERDVQRDTDLRRLGWRVLYVTWEKLTREPDRVMSDVRRGLSDAQLFR